MKAMKWIHLLLNGSTRIRSLSFNESSISFFLTHWIPKLAKVAVIDSLLISSVQTPLLQISLPTSLCGCALNWYRMESGHDKDYFRWINGMAWHKLNSPIRLVFRDARNDHNSSATVVYNLYTRICFIVRCAVCAWYRTSRSSFTLVSESKSLWSWLLCDFNKRIRIWTWRSALATLTAPRTHCCGIHAIRLSIT